MSRLRSFLAVLPHAARCGFVEYYSIFTWKTWLAGWYVRVLSQVAFFALIGRLLHSDGRAHYLLIGNSVLLMSSVALFAVPSSAWERWAGTLSLLVASPTRPVVVYASRSVVMLLDGMLTSVAAFFVAAPLFGVPLPFPRVLFVPPLLLCVGLATYCLAIFLGGWVARAPETRNVVSNLTNGTLLAICGVNVPLVFFPAAVRWLATVLPLTHGLRAIRELLAGSPATTVLTSAGLELTIGAGWLALALVTFDRWTSRGRRTGAIDFA